MNTQVDPTSSILASAMLNSKIRAVVGYGGKIFHPSPPNYVIRSPGRGIVCVVSPFVFFLQSQTVSAKIQNPTSGLLSMLRSDWLSYF